MLTMVTVKVHGCSKHRTQERTTTVNIDGESTPLCFALLHVAPLMNETVLNIRGAAERGPRWRAIGVVYMFKMVEDLGLCAKPAPCDARFWDYRTATDKQDLNTKPTVFRVLECRQI